MSKASSTVRLHHCPTESAPPVARSTIFAFTPTCGAIFIPCPLASSSKPRRQRRSALPAPSPLLSPSLSTSPLRLLAPGSSCSAATTLPCHLTGSTAPRAKSCRGAVARGRIRPFPSVSPLPAFLLCPPPSGPPPRSLPRSFKPYHGEGSGSMEVPPSGRGPLGGCPPRPPAQRCVPHCSYPRQRSSSSPVTHAGAPMPPPCPRAGSSPNRKHARTRLGLLRSD